MKHIKLFYKNGAIKELFDWEADRRLLAEYSERKQREIARNMLTNPDAAVELSKRWVEIQTEVKAEIEAVLGFSVDVGFDPSAATKALTDRVGDLESSQTELTEALTMILEGVTE